MTKPSGYSILKGIGSGVIKKVYHAKMEEIPASSIMKFLDGNVILEGGERIPIREIGLTKEEALERARVLAITESARFLVKRLGSERFREGHSRFSDVIVPHLERLILDFEEALEDGDGE